MTTSSTTLRRRAVLAAALALPACAGVRSDRRAGAEPTKGRVVLLRGLINIFSTGMDTLTAQLRAAGWNATVHNHTAWYDLADELAREAAPGQRHGPVAAVGHSLGSDDAIRLGGALGSRGVALDLLCTFDPVLLGTVIRGPRRVVNYFQTTGLWGRPLSAGPGFDGWIDNVAVDRGLLVNHFNIEKDPTLHADVIARLNWIASSSATRAAQATPPRALPLPPRRPVRGG